MARSHCWHELRSTHSTVLDHKHWLWGRFTAMPFMSTTLTHSATDCKSASLSLFLTHKYDTLPMLPGWCFYPLGDLLPKCFMVFITYSQAWHTRMIHYPRIVGTFATTVQWRSLPINFTLCPRANPLKPRYKNPLQKKSGKEFESERMALTANSERVVSCPQATLWCRMRLLRRWGKRREERSKSLRRRWKMSWRSLRKRWYWRRKDVKLDTRWQKWYRGGGW